MRGHGISTGTTALGNANDNQVGQALVEDDLLGLTFFVA